MIITKGKSKSTQQLSIVSSPLMAEMKKCPNCGTMNDTSASTCKNCLKPLNGEASNGLVDGGEDIGTPLTSDEGDDEETPGTPGM